MKNGYKAIRIMILSLVCLMSIASLATAQEDVVEQALAVCQPEIESYCSQVTPGDGRLLACFIAHEDKLSGECGWALYEAMDEVEAFVAAVAYVAESCWDDIVEHCSEVEMGEGRVAVCLVEHEGEVSTGCKAAMEEVELEVIED